MLQMLVTIPTSTLFFLFVCGLVWGSLLNTCAHRLLHGDSLFQARFFCPACRSTIAWYDLIPLISYIVLAGRCRKCRAPISYLYPLFEVLMGVTCIFLLPLLFSNAGFFYASFLFVSALFVSARTDMEAMLVPLATTGWMVPFGIALSAFGWTHITPIESIFASCIGYGSLWLISKFFFYATGRDGMGEGDMYIVAMIGSFTGLLGVWTSVMIGSVIGSLVTVIYLFITGKDSTTRVPFGPFLALGGCASLFLRSFFLTFFI